jgi:DNA polymerase-3 subunit epsilon
MPEHDRLAEMAEELRRSPEYRVLERLRRRPRISDAAGRDEGVGLVVDVETTGRDAAGDSIIQLAAVRFRYVRETGAVTTVDEPVTGFEDPGRPIPGVIQELTGITDETVRGQRLDDARFTALAEEADLVIAHNAAFDRPFLEARLPAFRNRPWACTWAEVPWGPGSQTLEMLLMKHCDRFVSPHRADEDSLAVIELLTARVAERPVLSHLLEAAGRTSVRVMAVGAAFEVKDRLKDRGYRWWNGSESSPRCWVREIPPDQWQEEQRWLEATAYPPGRCRAIFDELDATRRFRGLDA